MISNLIIALSLSIGVGVSSFSDHNNDINKSDIYNQDVGLTNLDDAQNILDNNRYIYFDSSLDLSSSDSIYYLPSYNDIVSLGFDLSKSANIRYVLNSGVIGSPGRVSFDVDTIEQKYDLIFSAYGNDWVVYSLSSDNEYIYDGYLFAQFNISFQLSYLDTFEYENADVYKVLIFYFSTFRFKGSIYNFYNSKPVHLFSTALINDFFGLSSIHGVKTLYRGWYKHNGVFYDTIRATCIDAYGTKYYNGRLVGSSSALETLPNQLGVYIYLMNVEFYNSVSDYSFYAYLPVYYTYDNTVSTYIDISANGWVDNKNVEFLSISVVGKPQGRSDLNNLGYYDFITHANDLVASSNNIVSNYWLNSSFNLINSAFAGLSGLFSIQILPFVNLGTLLFLPILFVIVFAIVKLFKR